MHRFLVKYRGVFRAIIDVIDNIEIELSNILIYELFGVG
jgi:hypothetical protein